MLSSLTTTESDNLYCLLAGTFYDSDSASTVTTIAVIFSNNYIHSNFYIGCDISASDSLPPSSFSFWGGDRANKFQFHILTINIHPDFLIEIIRIDRARSFAFEEICTAASIRKMLLLDVANKIMIGT